MAFTLPVKVLFQHCDPAGIVFYPRYFEMINLTVEEWFEQALGHSFATMQKSGFGVPTASIKVDFPAPSRLGETLSFKLAVTKLGKTSAHLEIDAGMGRELRLTARSVIVYIDKNTGRPVRWPDAVREKIQTSLD